LEALQREAADAGEDSAAKSIATAAKSCRWADKQRANRVRRVGNVVASLQSKGLSAEEIVARLTSGRA
jgi:hypothetical protein